MQEIRSFGRIKTRILPHNSKEVLTNSKFLLNNLSDYTNLKFSVLEIGFGMGDFLLEEAFNNSEIFYLGMDVYLNGIASVLKKIEEKKLNNLFLINSDCRLFNFQTYDKILILFPDPWPKKKHNKRRLLSKKFLLELYEKLNKDGIILIATDNEDYFDYIIGNLQKNNMDFFYEKGFPSKLNYPKTKYGLKAEENGIQSYFITINRF